MPNRRWDTVTEVADINRTTKNLTWSPFVDLRDGFERPVQFVAAHPQPYAALPPRVACSTCSALQPWCFITPYRSSIGPKSAAHYMSRE